MRRQRALAANQDDTFSVNRQSELAAMFAQETSALFGVAIAVGLITLLVGGIGVMNIMLVAVTEADAVPAWAVVLSMLSSGGVGVVFGIYPANRASRLDRVEAMRRD